ncbi:MAG: DsbA family protein [Eubacteriales bacterium]
MKLTVYFDFVCPFCYLGREKLKRITATHSDVVLDYVPFELRRPPVPKTDPMHDSAKLERFDRVLAPEAKRLGIPMNLPWISPHPYTTLAMSGYLYAKDHGLGAEYIDRTFHAFYVDESDIGERPVIEQILADLGLEPAIFVELEAAGAYLPRLDAGKERGRAVGVRGIPAVELDGSLVDLDTVESTLSGTCGEDGCSF